jgi:hypothetical protein
MQRRTWLMAWWPWAVAPGLVQGQAAASDKEPGLHTLQRLKPLLGNPRLVGEHRFTYWGFDVYHASLWANSPAFAAHEWATQRLVLELRYLRDFQSRDIAQRSIAEMHSQRPLSPEQSQTWLQLLQALLPNVRSGDTLTGLYQPEGVAQFFHQGKALGDIREAELARRFFGIWLSPQTSQPLLRQQLLAGASP